jgi:hypothetical protein
VVVDVCDIVVAVGGTSEAGGRGVLFLTQEILFRIFTTEAFFFYKLGE